MRPEPDVAVWIALTEALAAAPQAGEAALSPLGAGLLAAVALGISGDSRSFARDFETAHALALREAAELSEALGLLAITRRDERTQRAFLALTPAGAARIDHARRRASGSADPSR